MIFRRLSLTAWIFIALAVGIAIGVLFPSFGVQLTPISNIFLRLIKSIIAPLLFGTLVSGIAGTGSVKAMGRIGLKSIIYFEAATSVALFLGLACVNLIRPGDGVPLEQTANQVSLSKPMTGPEIVEHTFPTSVIDSMARGDVLQLVVFCFLFGMACASIGDRARSVVSFCESLAEVMFTYTRYVMYLAPFGVGAAIAATIGKNGVGVLFGLGKLVATLYLALVLFVVIVLGGVILLLRIPMKRFIKAVEEPWILAFSTASSEAALPIAMENMEEIMGVPKHIVSFVIPTGYSFNLDGSTLYLAVASVFVAQAAGIALSLPTQLAMMLTLMLTSKGVAAVPRASLVILAGTLATFNLPAAGVFVILGVDAIMDMARTSVNVLGNCLACAVVARWEGHPLIPQERQPETMVEHA
jgi:proton glutamate symport protein